MKSYITLAQERMGMSDAAEQEPDECLSRLDEIQNVTDNPVENNDNNKTYEGKRKHLKLLQSQEFDNELSTELGNNQIYNLNYSVK